MKSCRYCAIDSCRDVKVGPSFAVPDPAARYTSAAAVTRRVAPLLIFAWALEAQAEHATWLHGSWWRWQGRVAARVRKLARDLDRNDVRWLFPRAGTLASAGRRRPRAARELVRRLRRALPGIRILPWVYGDARRHLGRGQRWLRRTARRLARLVAHSGADGIHLDVEPPFGSFGQIPGARIAALVRELRRRAPGALVSVAIHPLRTPSFPRGLKARLVSPLVEVADQIVVMMYDTAMADPERFRRAVAEQVDALGRLAAGHRARLWMGAAAYPRHRAPRWRRLHDPRVENVAQTTAAFRSALAASAHAGRWMGVALFAHYSARDDDWEALRRGWGARR